MKIVRLIWKRKDIIFIEHFVYYYQIALEHFRCISHLVLTARMRDIIPTV